MKIDLTTLTLGELVKLKKYAEVMIDNYSDGFAYECHLSSYGRRTKFHFTNAQSVQNLCYEYSGDNGITTVYTNNPSLLIDNYGSTYYFPTMEDAEIWREYMHTKNQIPRWTEAVDEWENRDSISFRDRPCFAPSVGKEELETYKKKVDELGRTIVMPVLLKNYYED